MLPQSVEAVCLDCHGKLIERASRLFGESEKKYTKVERNLLALVLACEKFEAFIDSNRTIFTTDCSELIRELKKITPARRVERILLDLPPDINPQLELRKRDKPELYLCFSEKPPDATFYTDGAAISNGKDGCRAAWGVYCLERPEPSAKGQVQPANYKLLLKRV